MTTHSLHFAPQSSQHPVRVAVIGGGAAGIASAYRLCRLGAQVSVFEAGRRLGGNCAPVVVPDRNGDPLAVDFGVSDFNRSTFHRFDAFLTELGLPSHPICEDATAAYRDGSTAWTCVGGRFQTDLPPERSAALEKEIRRFIAEAPTALTGPSLSLGDYLRRQRHSRLFAERYALPRAAACIVVPAGEPADQDMGALVRFWLQHGLVGHTPRQRRRVVGGMWTYCDGFLAWFRTRGGRTYLNHRVQRIERSPQSVRLTVRSPEGPRDLEFDQLVIAVDASQVARLLPQADRQERQALNALTWQAADVVVHRDTRLLPRDRAHWAAYHFHAGRPGEAMPGPRITFYPQRLAGVGADEVFVSVNPPCDPKGALIVSQQRMVHAVAATGRRFAAIQGRNRTWYAGSHLEAPHLHEQAFASGERVARALMEAVRVKTVAA